LTTPLATTSTPVHGTPAEGDKSAPVLDIPAGLATPKSTSSCSLPGCFASEKELEGFLSSHIKSNNSLARIKSGSGTVNDRRDVTYVVAAKMVDTWGSYPKKRMSGIN
jgi:hypothetical protein